MGKSSTFPLQVAYLELRYLVVMMNYGEIGSEETCRTPIGESITKLTAGTPQQIPGRFFHVSFSNDTRFRRFELV